MNKGIIFFIIAVVIFIFIKNSAKAQDKAENSSGGGGGGGGISTYPQPIINPANPTILSAPISRYKATQRRGINAPVIRQR